MSLTTLFIDKKQIIFENWFKEIINTYPEPSYKFLYNTKDEFANPVANNIKKDINTIFDCLFDCNSKDLLVDSISNIIKIRAVQNYTVAQVVGIFLLLKKVLRAELKITLNDTVVFDEYLTIESKIDDIIMLAFEIYTANKEQILDIKLNELKRKFYLVLEKNKINYEL